jgi:predicted O-linked N-acetylglucosamine transferase (SPINDLY family)
VPDAARGHYTEQIVTLPGSYQCNVSWQPPEPAGDTRVDHALPHDAFVFCCFNNSWKITPDVFAAWMRILQRVPDSVLWLLQADDTAAAHLRREAASRGIDAQRLVFAPRCNRAGHLARHAHADLCLDTFHYGAHTTASDALRMGVPVLTKAGDTFASRVATSLVVAAGLAELSVTETSAYEDLAVALASDAARLAAMKAALLDPAADKPLFEAASFARRLERAYLTMQQRRLEGSPPTHIVSTRS